MNRYDRRPRWRRAVLATDRLTASTKLVMIVLLDHMDAHGKVQHPVRDVAQELGIKNFRRVSDRITEAHRAGYLVTVSKAVHGRLAEYQATIPSDPETGSLGVISSDPETGSTSDPTNRVTRNRVTTPGNARNRVTSITTTYLPGSDSDEQQPRRAACSWCSNRGCPQCDPNEVAF